MKPVSPALLIVTALLAAMTGGCGGDVAASETKRAIAFSANRGGEGSVVLIRPDGRGRTRVGDGIRSPTWSADGSRLAVTRELSFRDTDIAVVDADGGDLQVVLPGRAQDDDAAFSADGRWIAFSRISSIGEGPPKAAIHIVRPDGTGLRRVTRGSAYDREPSWSPDGRRLAFTRAVVRGERLSSDVMVVAARGGTARRVVRGASAAWSPDGRRIAYVTAADRFGETCFHECAPSGEIHVVGADGRGDDRITRSRADDADPAWTADGRQILFSSDRSDRARHDRELWAMSANGGCVTRLTNASSWSGAPAWRPGIEKSASCERDGIAPGARRGIVDVDLAAARHFSGYPLFWLGQRHRGLLLSHTQRFDEGFADHYAFIYDDCGDPRPAACPPTVHVQSQPLCWWTRGPAPVRLRRVGSERGAPVYVVGRPTDEYAQAEIHTGESAVRLITDDQNALQRALSAVRPLDGEVGPLPPPARTCRRN